MPPPMPINRYFGGSVAAVAGLKTSGVIPRQNFVVRHQAAE
jgi:hypothetical protein